MFVNSITLAVAILSAVASASPLAPRQSGCHPNFSGRSVSIVTKDGTLEWGQGTPEVGRTLAWEAPSSAHGEFRVEFTGQADSSYNIKAADIPANNLFVGVAPRSNVLAWANGAGSTWTISCSTCSSQDASSFHGTYASGCTISRAGSGDSVRKAEGDTEGSLIRFWGFQVGGVDDDKFDFVLA